MLAGMERSILPAPLAITSIWPSPTMAKNGIVERSRKNGAAAGTPRQEHDDEPHHHRPGAGVEPGLRVQALDEGDVHALDVSGG